MVELCGLKGPKELQGKSAVSLLEDPTKPGKDAAFTQVTRGNGMGHSIRTDRWRYTEWGTDGANGVELYDHEKDPHEYTNVAKEEAHGEVLRQLRTKLRAAYPSTQPVLTAK